MDLRVLTYENDIMKYKVNMLKNIPILQIPLNASYILKLY